MRYANNVCCAYSAAMGLLLIMFVLPKRLSISLAGQHFTGTALGIVLLCTSFIGFFVGIFGILLVKGCFRLIGAILAVVSVAVLTQVFIGYASY